MLGGLTEELCQSGRIRLVSSALFLQSFRKDKALLVVKVALQAAALAVNGLASLPECVWGVCLMLSGQGFVNAGAC